ncbi:hypothetical protein STEG23_000811, partial [Scotinomys teguina]
KLNLFHQLQDVQYTSGRWYLDGAQSSCHTSTFAILLTEEETGQMRLEDVRYAPGRWFPERDYTGCQTSTVAVLMPKEGVPQIPGVFLLKETIAMLESWENSLPYLENELSHMEEAPNDIISRAKNIETKIKELIEALKRIISKIDPGFPESYMYSYWNGLAYLRAPDEDTRFFAFYNLFRCLTKDSHKVDSNLSLLKCELVYKTHC